MRRSFDDFRATVRRLITNDIVDDLKSGHNRFAAASGPMAEEISCSTLRLKDEDLQAIASYLKDLPGESPPASALPADDLTMRAGGAIGRWKWERSPAPHPAGLAGASSRCAGTLVERQ